MAELFSSQPIHLDSLRSNVLERFSLLLHEYHYAFISRENTAALISALLREIENALTEKNHDTKLLSQYCARLNDTMLLLHQQQQKKSHHYQSDLIQMIPNFNQVIEQFGKTIVEKSLIVKQATFLEKIITLNQHATQEEIFFHKIMLALYDVFPFRFFLMLYTEENDIYFNIYYGAYYAPHEKKEIQTILTNTILKKLSLKASQISEIKHIDINHKKTEPCDLYQLPMISMNLNEQQRLRLSPILDMSYVALSPLHPEEESVVHSLLDVMSITIHFSKTLGHYLKELSYHATHDPLTGVHNRRYFNEILRYEIARSDRYQHEFVVLMIDVDNFKDVNDSYGLFCGDVVLKGIAKTITDHVRKGDVMARIGGDEFALILMAMNMENGKKSAETLREKISQLSFHSSDHQSFGTTISIGVVHYPSNAKTISDLMAGVDAALYRAKKTGKNAVYLFDAEKDHLQMIRDTQSTVEMLRMALIEGRIVPFFQPIIDCQTNDIFAYETLARLHTLDGKIKTFAEFGEVIETHGLSQLFNETIIVAALKKLSEVHKSKPNVRLFINVSPQAIHNHQLLNYAENLCAELHIPPDHIIFEILERDAIIDIVEMKKTIYYLNNLGFQFALDDFGTGYNSFHYLQELSFKYVKLEGSFVKNIVNSKTNYVLIKNIVQLCRDLGIKTVAEYVESREILTLIQSLGVDYAQGYYTGKPLPHFL